jgi:hypothetical protein
VRLHGRAQPGSRDRELVVTLSFLGDAIVLVQEQRMPAPPVEAQAIVLPDPLKTRSTTRWPSAGRWWWARGRAGPADPELPRLGAGVFR